MDKPCSKENKQKKSIWWIYRKEKVTTALYVSYTLVQIFTKQCHLGGLAGAQRTPAALTSFPAACSSNPHRGRSTSSPIILPILAYQFLTMAFYLICVPVSIPSPALHVFNCFPALTPHLAPTPITLLKATCLLLTPPHLCLVQGESVLFHESSFKILMVPLFCRRGNGDLERLGNLPQVTKLESGRA